MILIVDGNNISFAGWAAMNSENTRADLVTNMGIKTTVIFTLFRSLYRMCDRFKISKTIICWDGGSIFRKKIFKHYKGNRKPLPNVQDYYDNVNVAREYLAKLGVEQYWCKGIEADDIIGWLSKKYSNKGESVLVMSDDVDFFQLSCNKIKFYRPTSGNVFTKDECEEKLGYSTKLLPRVLAFAGQKKDNIPGACNLDKDGIMVKEGLGDKTAYKMLCRPDGGYYKIKQAINSLDKSNRFYDLIMKNKKGIRISYKLAKIRTKDSQYLNFEIEYLKNQYSKYLIKKFIRVSMIRNIQELLEFNKIDLLKTLIKIGIKVQ